MANPHQNARAGECRGFWFLPPVHFAKSLFCERRKWQSSFSCVVSIFGKQWAEFALGKISIAALSEIASSWQWQRCRGETIASFYVTRFSLLQKLNSRLPHRPWEAGYCFHVPVRFGALTCSCISHSAVFALQYTRKIKFQHIELEIWLAFISNSQMNPKASHIWTERCSLAHGRRACLCEVIESKQKKDKVKQQ